MKTFQEFLEETYLILEKNRYDDSHGFDRRLSPEEKKEFEIGYDGPREKKEVEAHYKRLGREMPYEPGHTTIYHKPTGITYEIKHHRPENENPKVESKPENFLSGKGKKAHGHKPSHEIQWYPQEVDTSKMSMAKRVGIAKNAQKVWNKIQSRFPSGHLLVNEPESERLRRGYSERGFGNTTPQSNRQYAAIIGSKLHPVHREAFEMNEDMELS